MNELEEWQMRVLREWQMRVLREKRELDDRIAALHRFIRSREFDALPIDEQWRMTTQSHVMVQYSAILGARIESWA